MPFLETLIDPRVAKEFGPSEQDRAAARSNAFIQAGLGMIGARGGLMNAISQGGLLGFDSYNRSLENAQRAKAYQFQTGLELSKLAKQQDQERAIAEAIAKESPDVQQAVRMGVPYQEIWKSRNQERKPQLVTVQTPNGPMQRWVNPGESNGVDIGAPENKEGALPWYVRRTPDGRTQIDPAYADLERTKASFGRPPAQPMQPVAYVDPASGQTVWGTIAEAKGKPAANFAPSIQGQIVTAKETAKAGVEQQTDATKAIKKSNQLLSAAQEAEALLRGNVTQSGIGAVVDAAGRIVGASPESSRNAAKLEALSGWMVANVPRMEGPQSNFDVKNYQEMAGKIGDRTIPVAERQAALKTVVALQEKYKDLNSGASQDAGTQKPVRRYNPQTGRIE